MLQGALHPFKHEALFSLLDSACYQINRNTPEHESLADILGGVFDKESPIPHETIALMAYQVSL
jgi:hypothetical protein